MPLTVTQINNAKPGSKISRLSDGAGLTLLIYPNGSKRWRIRYYYQNKAQMLSLGTYPIVGLKEARDKAQVIKRLLAEGRDPSKERKLGIDDTPENHLTFEYFARRWMASKSWSANHARRNEQRLSNNVFPLLGNRDIREISEDDLRDALKRVEDRGALETQKRICSLCNSVFRYARSTIKDLDNPADFIKDNPPQPIKRNFPTITKPESVGQLLMAVEQYAKRATIEVGCALQLAPYVLLRPGNIVEGEWTEINFEEAEWTISAEKMKMRRQHIVPLSTQSIELLKFLNKFTGKGKYLFPSHQAKQGHITTDALRVGIQRAGYAVGEFTTHGFRHMGTTLLNELGYRREWIELQMAHVESNSIVRVYNHAQYLNARHQMMQEWANYLDNLKMEALLL